MNTPVSPKQTLSTLHAIATLHTGIGGLRAALLRISRLPRGKSGVAAEAVGIAQGALGIIDPEPTTTQCFDCSEQFEEESMVTQQRADREPKLVCPACARAAEPQDISIGRHNQYSL